MNLAYILSFRHYYQLCVQAYKRSTVPLQVGVQWVGFIPQKLNTTVQMKKICTGRLNTDGILVSGGNGCCQCGEVVLCFVLYGPRVLDRRLFLWSLLVPEHLHEEGHV